MKTLPNFLILGPPRTGTTWLYHCLSNHKEIFLPRVKQLHFFDKFFHKGVHWYKSRFNVSGETAIGEITPDYFCRARYAERIADTLTDVKLVILFRDPVERAFSQYKIRARRDRYGDKSFMDVYKEDDCLMHNSLYGENLSAFLKFSPAEKFLIIDYNSLSSHPRLALNKIYTFLNVSHDQVPEDILNNRFSQSTGYAGLQWFETCVGVLRRILTRSKPGLLFVRLLKSMGIVKTVKSLNTASIPVLSKDEYAVAKKDFEADLDRFKQLVMENSIDYWHMGTG